MKFYNADKLFIGSVGYSKRINKDRMQFSPKEIAVTKQSNYHPKYYYFDALSNKEYIDFNHTFCCIGDACIFEPRSLAITIKKIYSNTQQFETVNSIAKKILKGKK